MKSVLISIQPQWVEKIVNGEKTIEVRKTAPKCETPFKCYIYMTQGKLKDLGIYSEWVYKNRMKVIGEFICDNVYMSFVGYRKNEPCYWDILNGSCLTKDEIMNYGKWKTLYGWHISDLKIYDKPKELREFFKPCPTKEKGDCLSCDCLADNDYGGVCTNNLTRPPQSYMFVEDLGETK